MATAAPLRSSTPPGNNQDHLYRLLNLTVDEGTSIVRQIFDEKRLLYKPKLDLNTFLTQERSTIQNNKQIQLYLKDKLFPKSGTPTHSLENFDLTLLVSLLRNISSLGLQGPWKNEPKPGEEKPEDDLRRLQIMRNSLAHIESTKGISKQDFHSKWSDTENVLYRLNKSLNCPDQNLKQRIKECKTKSLDSKGLEQIIDKLQTSINSEIELLKTHVDNHDAQLQKHDKDIQSLKTNQEQQKSSEESSAKQKAEDEYQQTKEMLKEDLAHFYRDRHSTIPLSPLFEETDTPLLDFYLMPGMNVVKSGKEKEVKTAIQTLSEVYKSGSKCCQEVYITADAGFGKTAFSKYMTVLWCQAHFPDKNHTKHLKEEDINAMCEFKFLFLVLLRDSHDYCNIDDLIFYQVVQSLSRSKSYSDKFLEDVLHRERCLVVLDGLDEWTHPPKLEKVPQSILLHPNNCVKTDKSIPHRNSRKNCSVMTTTRPWKLSTLSLSPKQIDKKIELTQLDSNLVLELTRRALKKIRGKTEQTEMEEAEKLLNSYHDFEQVYVPLLLMYIICLWCEGKQVVKTKCELYKRIIDVLLSRTVEKYKGLSETERPQCISNIQQYIDVIPQGQEECNEYFTFLTSLGELAFERLFSETKENRLVFDSSIAEKCLKEDFLELGRLTGIITHDKQTKLTSQIRKTSFAHKTVQEYFAALYISTCSAKKKDEVRTKVLKCCKSIQDILDMSKVFIFISGLKAELLSSLSYELMEVINKDEITSIYRSTNCNVIHLQTLKEIQNMFVSCIRECPDKKDVSLFLQDFLFDEFEGQENYYRNLQRLALKNKTNITSIYIGEGVNSVSKIIDECKFSDLDIHCEVIICLCRCKEEELFRLLSTSVKSLYITDEGHRYDESNYRRSSLTDWSSTIDERKYVRSSLTDDWRSHLTGEPCKTFHNASSLEEIFINKVMMSHEFLDYIINVKSIKKITLNQVSCSDHRKSCPGINFDISQYAELRQLVLLNCTLIIMNKDESKDEHDCLTNEQLETIDISFSRLSHKLLNYIINVKSIKKISLCIVSCSDHNDDSCPGFNFDLSQHSKLRKLVLNSKYFTLFDRNLDERKDGLSCLIDEQGKTFYNSSQIETISIQDSKLCHELLDHILNIRSLKKIELRSSPCRNHGDSCPLFSFDLSKHPELKKLVLDLDSTLLDMDTDRIVLRNIKHVSLHGVKMSCSFLRRLVGIIETLEHSARVKIWGCSITPEEEFDIFKDTIRRSESFVVECDDRNDSDWFEKQFDFVTKK